ncbi:hypothetical protein [Taibaiella soli]|uniref:Lipoprotein n=1 Tax=Taibaiella soli TaxID=1649169 RepID=A0A2W2AAQ5_9BACT|nr:hypothetical protein [Taibaiella soli]PZF72361.1 hypothetical protein DN068_13485 [Taibaiella soli]
MRSSRFLFLSTVLITAGLFTFTACHKTSSDDDVKQIDQEAGVASDQSTLEKNFSDVQSIADEAGTTGSADLRVLGGGSVLGGCATVTRDTVSVPHTITVNFGTAPCLCQDGRYRSGEILVSYTGHYKDSGSVHSITFSNYFVDSNQVIGTKTVTNMGKNSSGQPYYDIQINGGVVLANNNGTISWTTTRTRTWVAGYNTPAWNDDVYNVTGSGSITRANGNVVTVDITSPLVVALACRWIEQGTVQVTLANGNTRVLDYGNGTCDALATYTVNGHTYNISLH